MGRATRWLKGIFGIKNPPKTPPNPNPNPNPNPYSTPSNSGRRKMPNSGAGAGNLCNNPATIPPNITPAEVAWLKSYYSDSEEQSKHAIAVAAATAAAADAAVAAAQAAVVVVRLTSRGRNAIFSDPAGERGTEKWAAVKIQTGFRGYLARKALRALRGLVKIQALVRGYLVRKQATATLHGMQALIRAQATVRSKRAQASISYSEKIRFRRSMEIFDDIRSEQEALVHSRRLSASFESRSTISPIIEDIPKIVEVDPGRPGSWDHDPFYPARLSVPICHHHCPSINNLGQMGHEYGLSSAQSTPRFTNPGAGTPSRSVCGDSSYYSRHNGNYQNGHPNYMAKTHSFRAKLRSQSAPKQRPDQGQVPKKRVSLSEMIESRNSLSGARMQRSCSQVQEAINFKNVVMGKFERSYEYVRERQRYHL